MSHTLEIPDPLYTALKEAADAEGLTAVDWIATHLPDAQQAERVTTRALGAPKTLADLFRGRVGRVRSGGAERLSDHCGEKFAEYLEEKRRAGHV